jgi:hypothetical protein
MMPAQKTRKNGSVMDMYYGAGEQSRKKAKKDVVIAGPMRTAVYSSSDLFFSLLVF